MPGFTGPRFLTASTEGFGHSTDIVVRLLSFMIKYGVAPNADIQLSFMPVDIAAHNITAVMTPVMVRLGPGLAGAGPSCDGRRLLQHGRPDHADQQGLRDFRSGTSLAEFSREMKRLATTEDPVSRSSTSWPGRTRRSW